MRLLYRQDPLRGPRQGAVVSETVGEVVGSGTAGRQLQLAAVLPRAQVGAGTQASGGGRLHLTSQLHLTKCRAPRRFRLPCSAIRPPVPR
ncbi:hypothetical protein BCD48_36700 [Pseudofrankia sp. BMG5.36]|nr:hypothetical protein BCD48_36700 [Pseudofrankia sp. BMG5.36]